jgi:hypothetical protein
MKITLTLITTTILAFVRGRWIFIIKVSGTDNGFCRCPRKQKDSNDLKNRCVLIRYQTHIIGIKGIFILDEIQMVYDTITKSMTRSSIARFVLTG